jgi:serine/threonine protein kinase
MAEIHLAKTKGIAGFEKYVALKMIHPNFAEDEDFIQMLVDEAKIAVQLNHGNIAQTFDLGRVGDTFYITMEFVDGADLYKILRRASQMDYGFPLDVCAFVAKEMASALDHAHRKRDHHGKSLGIVHRDVSPQNVLISYAGEVKLVDFGIAKATMKVRQTAVGVIKGKYYYMSPEQASGDPLDARSDIFSAGIVLYEMITGQMLYLEEDMKRLLDIVRRADIRRPSAVRKGVPPMLEKIVMRALAKQPADRYQSGADFASDLERFLHTYSPVFTAAKVSQLIKHVIGDPSVTQEIDIVEEHDGATGTVDPRELVLASSEIRDENSVLFRLQQGARVTRQAKLDPDTPPPPEPQPPASQPKPRAVSRPRAANEHTRELATALPPLWAGEVTSAAADDSEIATTEHTVVSPPQRSAFIAASDDPGDATVISSAPHMGSGPVESEETIDTGALARLDATAEEDAPFAEDSPTIQLDARTPSRRGSPPALAANIHAPAVSELRKPRGSRRTPSRGVPTANVLQALVATAPSEAMPTPPVRRPRSEDSNVATMPAPIAAVRAPYPPPPPAPVTAPAPYPSPASPIAAPYPSQPASTPIAAPFPTTVTPGSLYERNPMNPFGAQPQPVSLTGQLRLTEADAIPDRYKVRRAGAHLKLGIAAAITAPVAVVATYLLIKATRDSAPPTGSIHIESTPPGAEVSYDGTRLTGATPITIDAVPVGTRHEIKIELAHHVPHLETIDIPKHGGEVSITAVLHLIRGKLVVNTVPGGADVFIDGQLRGHTPTTITDIDMSSARRLELRLKDYRVEQDLIWPANGEIDVDRKLAR